MDSNATVGRTSLTIHSKHQSQVICYVYVLLKSPSWLDGALSLPVVEHGTLSDVK